MRHKIQKVTISDLKGLNPVLTDGGIKMQIKRNSEADRTKWVTEKVNGILQIHYNTIPKEYKTNYSLPSDENLSEALERLTKAVEKKPDTTNENVLAAIRLLGRYVEDNYTGYIGRYISIYPNDLEKSKAYAQENALRKGVMTLVADKTIKKSELHAAYLHLSEKRTITNPTKFSHLINNEWRLPNGISLVHGHTGIERPERKKLTDQLTAIIELEWSHPNGRSIEQVTAYVNKFCIENGLVTISESSVQHYIQKPEVRNRLMFYRNKEIYNKMVHATLRRKKALYPGDLVYMDGTPIQIPCLNREGKKAIRPTLFVVMDQCSGKIIGFSFTENEDRYTWNDAMKMAVSIEKILPYEWGYDNASPTLTEEFKQRQNKLEKMGSKLNPSKKGNPTSKANVERFFGTFQTGFQNLIDGYIGEGIRSKRSNARVDADFLKKVVKDNGYYTFESMLEIITVLISAYNQKDTPRRKAPSKLFAADKPNAIPITHEQIALLFWQYKTIKVRNSEVVTKIRNNQYIYEVYGHAERLQLNGTQVRMYYDETDLSEVCIFSETDEYISTLRQKVMPYAAKANQTPADVVQIIKQTSHNRATETALKAKTQLIRDTIKTDDALIVNTNHYLATKDEFNNNETDLLLDYVRDANSIDPRRVNEYEPVEVDSAVGGTGVYRRFANKHKKAADFKILPKQ